MVDAVAEPEYEEQQVEDAKTADELKEEHYEQTLALANEADAFESEYEALNEDAKAAKKVWEAAVSRLRAHIRRGPEYLPLIDKPEVEFMAESIERAITITDKQLEKLHAVGVKTVQQFETLRAGQIEGCPDGIRSISGFGESKVDQWEEEILNWLAKHQAPGESEVQE